MTTAPARPWTGQWLTDRFGVRLSPSLHPYVGLALRRNPKRAHLLVSTVLGKHVPADPRDVHGVGLRLGAAVGAALGGELPTVLGYAETATGLGHCVAEALAAPYLHSTRRHVATAVPFAGFEETHSHATSHLLLPEDDALLTAVRPLVLVDDELSTGSTALNTIAAVQAVAPRPRYVIAALVDVRDDADAERIAAATRDLGVRIDVVSLQRGVLDFPAGVRDAAAAIAGDRPVYGDADGVVVRHDRRWPGGVRESGRHGFGPDDVCAARRAADQVADGLVGQLTGRTLVLGTEELMYAPLLVALALQRRGVDVRVSSTTRSPVVAIDAPGYPIRSALTFARHDSACDGTLHRYAYNVTGFDEIVLVVDDDADTPGLQGLLWALQGVCPRVHVVPLPTYRPLPAPLTGPDFGSYRSDEVRWLLTDLSHAPLEAPVEEREEAIQNGGAHYAESLPVEYQPSAEYRALFDAALDESAARIAHAVGVVTEIVLAERGHDVVLASLARAGTPIGVLMRRWAAYRHGLDLPHYTLSIVRGRGIDLTALRYLAAHHDPAGVVFVDGWTGKGAIARELEAAIRAANESSGTAFVADLAVLADPGECVPTFGTRADFLIPSACLNSTVSGLVSRTVRNPDLLAPGQFDGAKFYAELAPDDMSGRFLDSVSARFADVADAVRRDWPSVRAGDRTPTWAGWAAVERISVEYGIGDTTLVKPGVGETTRVLLRRVPWLVLARPGAPIEHVRLLAAQRGVEVREAEGLPYQCVGLIHPRYTRGATGADGRAAAAP
jgi:adenine/guanine phosphoribosyltransferase-like PRPP-binding protein